MILCSGSGCKSNLGFQEYQPIVLTSTSCRRAAGLFKALCWVWLGGRGLRSRARFERHKTRLTNGGTEPGPGSGCSRTLGMLLFPVFYGKILVPGKWHAGMQTSSGWDGGLIMTG